MKPYVIRRLRPYTFVPLLGAAGIVAFVIAFDFAWWFAAAAAMLAVSEAWRATLVLRVDDKGVRIGQRPSRRLPQPFVSWPSIHEVALTETDPPEIEVRLKQGAPLPEGVNSAIHDPSQRSVSAPRLRMPVPGADRLALGAAVEGFGGGPLRSG